MTVEKIKSLFPVTLMVKQEDIDTARRYHITECIGAKTLRRYLLSEDVILHEPLASSGIVLGWGSDEGHFVTDGAMYNVESSEDMMNIKKPQFVTFRLAC